MAPSTPPKKRKEKLETLQERLYERGGSGQRTARTKLSRSKPADVSRGWGPAAPPIPPPPASPKNPPAVPASTQPYSPSSSMPKRNAFSYRRYRSRLLLGGLAFFSLMLIVSGFFLIWGNNRISGENISIEVSGPFAVGGGEALPLRIAVSNQNAIAIESATLIIEYPSGTQSAEQEGRELFIERRQLDVIEAGQVHNVSVQALVFGEENAEKIVKVSIEYRVEGSNATFYKEAAPFRFKISSSPVVLGIDAVRTLSSGQEITLTLRANSNSPTALSNVLVQANYPFGFDFSSADPSPVAGNNMWLIDELPPEGEETITVKGILTGTQNEEKIFDFSAGLANERDRFSLASIFTTISSEVTIEAPFLGVAVSIDGSTEDVVVIDRAQSADVRVTFTNTLDDTLYDTGIDVTLSGNALNDISVDAGEGFYDSGSNRISYDSVALPSLREIAPGRSQTVSFTLYPNEATSQTPEINLQITVRGKRVFEDRVPQELIATASRTVRVSSLASLSSSVIYSGGPFANTGPVPPVAEETTTYTIELRAQNGSNDVAGAEVTATMPQYVTWLGNFSPGAGVTYNSSTRTVVWNIGSLSSNANANVSIQVGVTPSLSQVGTLPTIMDTQRLRATDRFTGATIRAQSAALTTAVDGDNTKGRVQSN